MRGRRRSEKNGWPAFLWVVVMLLFAVCLAFGGTGMKAQAAEREKKEDDGIFLGDLSAIEQFLGQKESLKTGFSFEELVKALMAGNGSRVGQLIVKGLYEALLGEISHGSRLAGELLALGLIGAIFANFPMFFRKPDFGDRIFHDLSACVYGAGSGFF